MPTYKFRSERWFKSNGCLYATLFTLTCGAALIFLTLAYFLEIPKNSFVNLNNCSHEDKGSLKDNSDITVEKTLYSHKVNVKVPKSSINQVIKEYLLTNTQIERQRLLRSYCKNKTELNQKDPAVPNVLYNDKKGVIYCSVPKTGCTNWRRVFLAFDGKIKSPSSIKGGFDIHTKQYPQLLKLSGNDRKWRTNIYFSFVIVRHPFDRLFAAYRNKLLDPRVLHFREEFGSKILRMFRKGLSQKEYASGKNISFTEFVNYIIALHDKQKVWEFNEHWQLINKLCSPCKMKYNYIGKMETLEDDAEAILKQIGVDNEIKYPSHDGSYHHKTEDVMKSYYSQLPEETIRKLYEVYKEDFLAFGYNISNFLNMTVSPLEQTDLTARDLSVQL